MDKKQGKLIVIEGIDGSGKSTQIELLKQALASQGVPLQLISFPRYGENIYADLITRYLEGEFGRIGQIDPHFLALAYAGDRSLAKPSIEKWLAEGKMVITNRYVSSSKAHMGANLPEEKRGEFIKWVDDLEYQTLGIPKEDLTILLSVDPKLGQKNSINIGIDIHEENLEHLEKASKIYLKLARENNWHVIDCMEGDLMKPMTEINQELLSLLK